MKTRCWLGTALAIGAVLSPLAVDATAAPATQDSLVGSGRAFDTDFSISVQSGPSGENPTGSITGSSFSLGVPVPVDCLKVEGNRATAHFSKSDVSGSVSVLVVITDNGPAVGGQTVDTLDAIGAPEPCPDPSDVPIERNFLSSGDFVVVDAQPSPPLPTTKDQCKKGSWTTYGIFKNQGDCVSFVATKGKNPPSGH
jgi:hypothetical protein